MLLGRNEAGKTSLMKLIIYEETLMVDGKRPGVEVK